MIPVILAFLLALIGALITYWGVRPFVPFTLRFLGLFLLVAFFLGVSWKGRVRGTPELSILLDVSESMSPLSDWQDSTIERLLPPKGWKVTRYGFSSSILEMVGDSFSDTGRVTDLGAALSKTPGDAILLLSDGLYNTPRDPLKVAREKKRPVYVIIPPLKASGIYDVVLRKVEGDRRILEGGTARLKAQVQVVGGMNYSGKLLVSLGDSILKEERISVPPHGSREVQLEIPLRGVGLHELTFTLAPWEGERTSVNNQRIFAVAAVRGTREAWLIGWHPSPMVSTLRRFFEGLPGWGTRVLLQVEEGRWREFGEAVIDAEIPREGSPDLWVLIDPDPGFLATLLSKESMKHLMIFLEDPKPQVLTLLGLRKAPRLPKRKFYLSLGPGILGSTENGPQVDLPPLEEITGVIPPSAARPIFTIPAWKTPAGAIPVAAIIKEQFTKEIVVQSGDFWKIRLWNKELFDRVFSQALSEIFKGEGIYGAGVSRNVFFEGEPIQVWADAQSEEGDPLTDVEVNLVGLDEEVPLWPAGAGHYESPRLFLSPGKYDLRVVFKRGKEVQERGVSFKVMVGSPEVYDVGIDSLFLRRLAIETDARVLNSPEELNRLSPGTAPSVEKTTHPLFGNPLFLLLFVIFMGLEWGLRKWRGLP